MGTCIVFIYVSNKMNDNKHLCAHILRQTATGVRWYERSALPVEISLDNLNLRRGALFCLLLLLI